MKNKITRLIRISSVVTALALASSNIATGITVTDDFNDNSMNTNYWSAFVPLNFGLLTETKQHLEYTTAGTFSSFDVGAWNWMPAADVNSLIVLQVDTYVPDLAITTDQRAGFGIALATSLGIDHVTLALGQRLRGGNFYKSIGSSVVKGASEVDSADVAVSASVVSLRLTWSPGFQYVTAEYDLDGNANGYVWTRLAQWPLSNYGWPSITNLTGGIFGESRNRTINSADTIFGDNWQITYTPVTRISPALGITVAGTNAVLTWPTNAVGFSLEWATNLPSATWTSNSTSPSILNGQYIVTNSIVGSAKFYRLKK